MPSHYAVSGLINTPLDPLQVEGTCSKGGRWLKKGGIGARAKGAGRKDEFAHIKLRATCWLEKERSMCHHVDRVDLVEEFLEQ